MLIIGQNTVRLYSMIRRVSRYTLALSYQLITKYLESDGSTWSQYPHGKVKKLYLIRMHLFPGVFFNFRKYLLISYR